MHYKITIKNYYKNGVLNKDETVLYTIPLQDSNAENVLTDPTVSCEIGKTGTFEFTIHPNHPYYHAIAQMRTIMRVEYDGDTIFRGRILTIDNTLTGAKRIHCEGEMAFLLDSFQMSTVKETRKAMTIKAYITQVLTEHNRQMSEAGEDDKKIYPGYIPGAYPSSFSSTQQINNVSDTFGSDSAEQTMSALESLTEQFGGFFRTRYSASDKKTYLDWCRNWFRDVSKNGQPIAITQNIIDAQSNSEVDNIFTAVIPVGSKESKDIFITGYKTNIHGNNNRILVPQILSVYTKAQLNNGFVNESIYKDAVNRYGIIYKVQKFQNADTKEKLWSYACDWIKNNYVGGITAYDLSAMDMHHVDGSVVKYLPGDRIKLTLHSDMIELDEYTSDEDNDTVYRTLLSIKYDLHHPDKDSYTAGIPSDILNLEYGVKSTSKSKAAASGGKSSGAGKKVGGSRPSQKKTNDKQEEQAKATDQLAWKVVWDETHNNEEYQALLKKNGATKMTPALNASQLVVKSVLNNPDIDTEEEVRDAVTVVIDGQRAKVNILKPKTVAQKANSIESLLSSKYGDPNYIDPTAKHIFNIIQQDNNYWNAASAFMLDAGMSALKIKGKDAASMASIENNLDKSTPPEEGASSDVIMNFVDDITSNIPIPNDVATLAGNTDASGNMSGIFSMAKEDNTNVGMDAGGNGGSGTANVGKETKSGGWLIQMNQPLRYKDDTGKVFTIPNGTIDAKDYSMLKQASGNVIPSFSTKFAVVTNLISETIKTVNLKADQATVTNLSADLANVKKLVADYAILRESFTFDGDAVRFNAQRLTTTYLTSSYFTFRGGTVNIERIRTGDNKYVSVLAVN